MTDKKYFSLEAEVLLFLFEPKNYNGIPIYKAMSKYDVRTIARVINSLKDKGLVERATYNGRRVTKLTLDGIYETIDILERQKDIAA